MIRIGYARVSTLDQNPATQTDALTAAECERVFTDHGVSGASADFHAANPACGQANWNRRRRPCHQGTMVSARRSDWRRTGE